MGKCKSSTNIFVRNLLRAVFWLAVLLFVLVMVQGRIDSKFELVGTSESVKAYSTAIYIEFAVIAAGSALWWAGALTGHDGWRRIADQYSFFLSLIYCAFIFAFAVGIFCFAPGIRDNNGYPHELLYVFTAPLVFLGLLYGVVPEAMQEVILPCRHGKMVRYAISAAAAALVILIVMR